jgi:hypothetical protein
MNPTWQPVPERDVLEALHSQGVSPRDAETMHRELQIKLEHQAEGDMDATVGRMVGGQLVTLHRDAGGFEIGVVRFPTSLVDEASSLSDDGVQATMLEVQRSLNALCETCQAHWSDPPSSVRHWMAGLDSSGPYLALESWLQFGELLEEHRDAPEIVLQAWLSATGVALVEGTWVNRAATSSQA